MSRVTSLTVSRLRSRSLAQRLVLVLVPGLLAVQGLGAGLLFYGRGHAGGEPPSGMQQHGAAPLAIEAAARLLPEALWLPALFLLQSLLLLSWAWVAVRATVRPLVRLVEAAASMQVDGTGRRFPERGAAEVVAAGAAFNTLQDRIARHLKDRLQFLAAVSHDLQAPITRMRLRTESMDASSERDKLSGDLQQMEHLVRESMAYARIAYGIEEAPLRIDLDALLDSLVCDYQDVGARVSLRGHIGAPLTTHPHALRRVVGNLVDNAVRYGGTAEVVVRLDDHGAIHVDILDRGPGIAAQHLDDAMLPFHRGTRLRTSDTGGAGLGLAIAQQLARAMGGSLGLRNRDHGGLAATLSLRRDPAPARGALDAPGCGRPAECPASGAVPTAQCSARSTSGCSHARDSSISAVRSRDRLPRAQ